MVCQVIHLSTKRADGKGMRTLCNAKSRDAYTTDFENEVTCKRCRLMIGAARRAQTRPQFTIAERAFIHTCAQSVWNEIAFDVIQGTAEMKRIRPERVTIKRSDVMDMVLDADRIENEMRSAFRRWPREVQANFLARWNLLPYAGRRRLLYGAFIHAIYGL